MNSLLLKMIWGLFCFSLFIYIADGLEVNKNITRDQALEAIVDAETNIANLAGEGFSVNYMNDTIIAAKEAFKRMDADKNNLSDFRYDGILRYVQEISARKDKAYELKDEIRALELKINYYKEEGVNVSKSTDLFKKAEESFQNERYDEVEKTLADVESELELSKAEITLAKSIKVAGERFFQKYLLHIAIFVILLSLVSYVLWKKFKITKARNKLKLMKLEQEVILELIKNLQKQRFEEGSISESTYKIRMQVFKEKLTQINHTIPVLEYMIKERE